MNRRILALATAVALGLAACADRPSMDADADDADASSKHQPIADTQDDMQAEQQRELEPEVNRNGQWQKVTPHEQRTKH